VFGEVVVGERLLVRKQLVVKLPELALFIRAIGSFRGGRCSVVESQREVTEDNPDLVAVSVLNLL